HPPAPPPPDPPRNWYSRSLPTGTPRAPVVRNVGPAAGSLQLVVPATPPTPPPGPWPAEPAEGESPPLPPDPPAYPPGPPAPPEPRRNAVGRSWPCAPATLRNWPALMVTNPVARMITGVLLALDTNFRVTAWVLAPTWDC